MAEPELTKIQDLIQELDESVPRAGALVRVDHGGKIQGHVITGNRSGLLRLGVESLRAGLLLEDRTPELGHSEGWDLVDTEYLKAYTSFYLHRDDSLRVTPTRADGTLVESRGARIRRVLFSVHIGLLFYGFIILAIIGLITVVRWLV